MQEISILPGRIRVKSPQLYFNRKLSRYLNVYIDNLYGIQYSSVNPATASILVVYDASKVTCSLILQNIKNAIQSAVTSPDYDVGKLAPYQKLLDKKSKSGKKILIYSLLYAALKVKHSFFGKFFLSSNFTALKIASAVTIIGGYPLIRRLYKRFTKNIPADSDILLSLTALSMTLMRESSKGVLVLLLKALNDYIKLSADVEGQRLVNQSMTKTAGMAWVNSSDSQKVLVPVEAINPGDQITVHPGEIVPLQGTISEGTAVVNSLYHTGQPLISQVGQGNKIHEGASLLSGRLTIKVEQAQTGNAKADVDKKDLQIYKRAASYQEFITPISIGAGAISYLITGSLLNALSVLLVLTPSAAATAVSTGLKSYAALLNKHKIHMRNINKLESVVNTTHILLDKTGTLTYGKMRIIGMDIVDKRYTAAELLRICAACEADNYHPISITLLEEAAGDYDIRRVESSVLLPSKGIVSTYDHRRVLIGNLQLLEENQIDPSLVIKQFEEYQRQLYTPVLICIDNHIAAILVLQDLLRHSSPHMIEKLRKRGYSNVALLTGDTQDKAMDMAGRLGISRVYAGCTQEEKARVVDELKQEGTIMMAGDGVNDVMSMNSADISISFVNSSCDRVKQHSDAIILEDEMDRLPDLLTLSKKSYAHIHQSITFSQLFNLTLGVLAIFGRFDPFSAKSLNTVNSMLVLLLNKRIEYLSPRTYSHVEEET